PVPLCLIVQSDGGCPTLFSRDSNCVVLPSPLRADAPGLRACFEKSQYRTICLCLLSTLLQSLFLLPIPLLQFWVIDRLVVVPQNQPISPADQADILMVIGAALGATIVCFVPRTVLSCKGSAAT